MTGVPCILCSGTDYARDCAGGQCHAQQLNLLNDPEPITTDWQVNTDLHRRLDPQPFMRPGRHDRGWPHDR